MKAPEQLIKMIEAQIKTLQSVNSVYYNPKTRLDELEKERKALDKKIQQAQAEHEINLKNIAELKKYLNYITDTTDNVTPDNQ
jgi:hypothetical protein